MNGLLKYLEGLGKFGETIVHDKKLKSIFSEEITQSLNVISEYIRMHE